MADLTPYQIAQTAAAAGFRGQGLVRAVAVALAESGGNPRASYVNADKWRSRDRGLWMLNNHWHPEVSDAQAYNPTTAAAATFTISKAGSDWHEWATWPVKAGAEMGRAQMAVSQLGTSAQGSSAEQVGLNLNPLGGVAGGVLGGAIGGLPGMIAGGLTGAAGGPAGVPDAAKAVGGTAADGVMALPDAITSLAKAAAAFVSTEVKAAVWVADPHNWLRVVEVAGGVALLIVGVRMLAASGAGPVSDGLEAAGSTVKAAHAKTVTAAKTAAAAAAA